MFVVLLQKKLHTSSSSGIVAEVAAILTLVIFLTSLWRRSLLLGHCSTRVIFQSIHSAAKTTLVESGKRDGSNFPEVSFTRSWIDARNKVKVLKAGKNRDDHLNGPSFWSFFFASQGRQIMVKILHTGPLPKFNLWIVSRVLIFPALTKGRSRNQNCSAPMEIWTWPKYLRSDC